MNLSVSTVAATAGLASMLAQGLLWVASGSFAVGGKMQEVASQIETLAEKIELQDEHYNTRIAELETSISKMEAKKCGLQ